VFGIQARDGNDQGAFLAFAGDDNLAVFAAFEDGGEAIEADIALLLFLPVTLEARGFEDGLDVLGVGQALFGRRFRQFAEVDVGRQGAGAQDESCDEQKRRLFHKQWADCVWIHP
jgi:hypothetical protein